MVNKELGLIATNDLVAVTRGRAMQLGRLEGALDTGCGWVPANLGIGAFGHIVEEGVYGATGDLRLIPDPATRTRIPFAGDKPALTIMLANITGTDGSPWDACPRTFLRRAIDDLADEAGLRVWSAFEHEFMELREDEPLAPFSLEMLHDGEPFGSNLVAALADAGLDPENWLPEYGGHQWEITTGPTGALEAADRAVLLRDIVRMVAADHGKNVTFAPLLDPNGSGNGVHVHISLRTGLGVPATFDKSRPGRLSEVAGSFAAGILKHARALVAITAPSVISYLRLVPHRWSAGFAFLGERNREALLRVCPTVDMPGKNPANQLNLEYRAGDAAANPWLVMGCLIRAGLEGIRAGLPTPPVVDGEVDDMSESEREAAGVQTLPSSLEEALQVLQDDPVVSGWFSPNLLNTYLAIKREEIAELADLSDLERCARYAKAY